jgi:hypothetical protein
MHNIIPITAQSKHRNGTIIAEQYPILNHIVYEKRCHTLDLNTHELTQQKFTHKKNNKMNSEFKFSRSR